MEHRLQHRKTSSEVGIELFSRVAGYRVVRKEGLQVAFNWLVLLLGSTRLVTR